MTLTSRIGFEIELLAPRQASRQDLAQAIADGAGASMRTLLHCDSELSEAPGVPVFHHLTPGFGVVDASDQPVALVVDDITIIADLDQDAPTRPGWARVLSDDRRLIGLLERQINPEDSPDGWLDELATVFGGSVQRVGDDDLLRAVDADGRVLAMVAGLPSERERPAELISPPIEEGHQAWLSTMLGAAMELDFDVPAEAAVHMHFDAEPFRNARRFQRLVRTLHEERELLRTRVQTNPRCTRLGPWDPEFLDVTLDPSFAQKDWTEARQLLMQVPMTKYCDINLLGTVYEAGVPPTIEFRIFPGTIDPYRIVDWAVEVESLLLSAK